MSTGDFVKVNDDGEFEYPPAFQNKPYTAKDIQLQAFVDNSCTSWLPNGDFFLGKSDADAGRLLKQLLAQQLTIANEG